MNKLGQMSQSSDSPHIFVGHLGDVDHISWVAGLLLGANRMDELRAFVKEVRGQGSEAAYQLSVGLARLEGDKAAFEDLAVEYAVNLGVNPPNWIEQHNKSPLSDVEDHVVHVDDLTFDSGIELTIKMESPWPIRIDLSGVSKFNEQGLELFNESMVSRTDRGLKTKVENGEMLESEILRHVKTSPIGDCRFSWDYLFMYYKTTGEKDKFESAFSIYQKEGGKKVEFIDLSEKNDLFDDVRSASSGITVLDKLSNLNQDLAKRQLASVSTVNKIKKGDEVVFDLTYVRSASFFDLDALSGFFAEMGSAGAKVRLSNVNELIMAILVALGTEKLNVAVSAPGAS